MLKSLTVLIFSTSLNLAYAERFSGANHPNNFRRLMGTNLITDFALLPESGRLSDPRTGWSETYWPSNKGGIAYRWNHPNPTPFEYRLYSLDELKQFSLQQLSQLSPAELYDISRDDYGYTLTRKTLSLFTKRDLWWEGICHGWAQAATHYPEPAPILISNRSGLRIPFGSSDVKALLSMHDAYNYRGEAFGFVGQRCRINGKVPGEGDNRDISTDPPSYEDSQTEACRDVNAGAFHIVLSNMIGILGRGFVLDIDRYNDVWNQPVVGYNSNVQEELSVSDSDKRQGIYRKISIKTKFFYGEELKFFTAELEAQGLKNFVSKLPVNGTEHQKILSRDYQYIIELNASGEIIGGEWLTETRPDFMWNYARSKKFKNSPIPLGDLGKIYKPVALKK